MQKKNEDNWAQLLTDLGLETSKPEEDEIEPAAPETPEPLRKESEPETPVAEQTVDKPDSSFGKGLLDEPAPESPSKKQREGKKTFFDRFPKINIFGTPAKESLDAVVEGAKTPSLSGKSFTSKTLEKAPERTVRPETPRTPAVETSVPAEQVVESPIPAEDDPWSQIASQVGSLSATTEKAKPRPPKPAAKDSSDSAGRSDRQRDKTPPRSRRQPPSLFDEEAPRESDEAAALKRLIDESDSRNDREEADRLESLFEDDKERLNADTRSSERSRGRNRRRGTKQRTGEELDSSRETLDEEPPKERTRGRRGSRHVEKEQDVYGKERDETRFSDEEYDLEAEYAESTWDIEEESKPVERAPRSSRRRGSRSEKKDVPVASSGDDFDDDDERSAAMPAHKNIPSWDDAISLIIQANKERHAQKTSESRRGRR